MGGCSSCIRKPVLVYQSILDECYNLLETYNNEMVNNGQTANKKKKINHNYKSMNKKKQSQKSASDSESLEFISQFDEMTGSIKADANISYQEFMKQDVAKLESQVRLQAKTLSDHIQDTHIRLIDTVQYLKVQLRSYQTDYGGQWITLLILEVLVQNLKNYTQKHISLKQGYPEDSNMASKIDNLTENNEMNNSTKEEKQHQNNNNNNQQFDIQQNFNYINGGVGNHDQITFFSDNFIRFEIDFIEIALFILNEKYNPFYAQSQNQFMNILLQFSSIHKDPYTSDRIFWLVDQLETDLVNMIKEVIPQEKENKGNNNVLPEWENINQKQVETLSILQVTYQVTLSKLKSQQNVFHSKQQLNLFYLTLQTIIDFNRILQSHLNKIKSESNNNNKDNNNPLSPVVVRQEQNAHFEQKPGEKSIQQVVAQITSNCLGIVSVFSRRSFILKNYNTVLSNLFQFFDSVMWDSSLLIDNIINETISVARFESVQLNYKVFLVEQLIEYLQLSKNLTSQYFNINFQQANVNNNHINVRNSVANNNENNIINNININQNLGQSLTEMIGIENNGGNKNDKKLVYGKDEIQQQGIIKLENYGNPMVKIRAFRLFNGLLSHKDSETPLLMHSTNKIVKCYLQNLKEYKEIADAKKAIQQSYFYYILQLAPDSSSLLSVLTSLSNEICQVYSSSNLQKTQQVINTPKHSPRALQPQSSQQSSQPQQQGNGVMKSPSELSNQNNSNIHHPSQMNDQINYIEEGLNLMLLTLECSGYFTSSPMIIDEIIINLTFISNLKQVQLIVFQVIAKLILLKMKPNIQGIQSDHNNNYLNNINSNSPTHQLNIISSQLSQNSLLHIFHQSIKCVFNLNMQQETTSISKAIAIYSYTYQIIQDIVKRNNVLQMRAIFAYIIKLVKETILFQSQKDNIQVQQYHSINNNSPDPAQFNSTNNQYVIQAVIKNGLQQNQPNDFNSAANKPFVPLNFKHPSCFNVTQIAIILMIQTLESHLSSNNNQPEQNNNNNNNNNNVNGNNTNIIINNNNNNILLEMINRLQSRDLQVLMKYYQDIFSIHQEQAKIYQILNYQVDVNPKLIAHQRTLSMKQNINEDNLQRETELNQKIKTISGQFLDYQFVSNELFNNNTIIDNLEKVAKSQGFHSELNFDQMTAEFARNFPFGFGDIDFNNYKFDDEQSLNTSAQKNSRNSHFNNYQRINTNESLGAIEREDEYFCNVMKMLQTTNINVPNKLDSDKNNGQLLNHNLNNLNKENNNNNNIIQSDKKQSNNIFAQGQYNGNGQQPHLDSIDVQIKVQ